MLKRILLLPVVLLAASLWAGVATAVTARLAGDAFTVSTASGANKGKTTTLVVSGPPDSSKVQTAYVQFDLSTLPAAVTASDISKATLTVFVNAVSAGGSFDVQRVTGAWTEGVITAGAAPPLGAVEQSAVAVTTADKNQYKVIDVTNVVKAWRSGSLTNNGLAIVANAVDGLNAKFDSKESTAHSQVPRLEITLAATAGSGTVTNVSAASPLSVTNPTTTPNLTLGTVPISLGGTNAASAASARTNLGAAASGANADITSLTGLTTPLTVGQGGTGAATAAAARSNIGAASSAANGDITALSGITGNISMPNSTSASAGNILKNGLRFLHNFNDNTFLGADAGNFTMTGVGNTGLGLVALRETTSGSSNTAVGYEALKFNTTGDENTAMGTDALLNNDGGARNVAIGVEALTSNTDGNENVAVGDGALLTNNSGSNNTAVGFNALNDASGSANTALGSNALLVSDASNNTAVGANVLMTNSSGTLNVGVGTGALSANMSGSSNTALGANALLSNNGDENVAVGLSALLANTTGTRDTGIGVAALVSNTTGASNTGVGRSALFFNTTGSNNTAVGDRALANNATGSFSTAVGRETLNSNTSGSNTAVGYHALFANTNGSGNTAVGTSALQNNTASQVTAVGASALIANTTGDRNCAAGDSALSSNTTGNSNTAVGSTALTGNVSGIRDTALGEEALRDNTSGNNNTALGALTLASNVSGSQNIAIGPFALSNSTSSDNIAIGVFGGQNLTSGGNNIDIGNSGVAAEANTIRIGTGGSHTSAFIAGISSQTSASGINVLINSSGKLGTTTSSRRFKDDIRDMSDASSLLMQLRPVTFHYKKEIDDSGLLQYGLIAEEVAKVYPDMVVYEDGQPQTVRYHFLVPMLLNELQKQHRVQRSQAEQIGNLRTQVAAATQLARDNDALRDRIARLEAVVEHVAMAVQSMPTQAAAAPPGNGL